MTENAIRRSGIALAVAALSLLLAACFLTPGKFTSNLDLRRDGTFAFNYAGEIHMLELSKLAAMGAKQANEEFSASACYNDDYDERPCSKKELDDQRKQWDDEQKATAEKKKDESEKMRAVFGGIDPSSPEGAQELANRLRKQAGWRKVDYKGNGLFEVDFAIAGRLNHDFTFPTIERFPLSETFVVVNLRADGSARVDAPGFAQNQSSNPFGNVMALAAMGGAGGKAEGEETNSEAAAALPQIDGRFSITTDGTILANNTDEGPAAIAGGQRLDWTITPRTTAAPTALVRLRN